MRRTGMTVPRLLRPAAVLAVAALATGALAVPASAVPETAPVWGATPALLASAGQGFATVSWNRLGNSGAGADVGTPAVTSAGYDVVVLQAGVVKPTLGCTTTPVNGTRMWCKVGGLTAGLPYTFKVSATNSAGTAVTTTATSPVKPFGVPKPPSVTTKAGYELVKVSWSQGDGQGRSISAYTVKLWRYSFRKPVATRTLKGSVRSTVFQGLTAGARYRATVSVVTGSKANPPVLVSVAPSSRYAVPTLPPATKLPLRLGQRGPLVYVLRQRLAWAGLGASQNLTISTHGTPATALFDKTTQTQVKHLQEKFLLDQTGVVDSTTWSTLANITKSKGALPSACQGTMVCISKTQKVLRYLSGGKVIKTMDVRFGAEYDPSRRTRTGLHAVYRMDADHVSSQYGSAMPWSMFFDGGQAIHYSSNFNSVGYYGASHGCVNVRDWDKVKWLYGTVNIGTPVYIYG